MLGSMLDKAEEGGVNISTAQLCSNEVQHGFKGIKKTMVANQLQIETLSFCMAAAQNAVGERVKIQIEGLNLKYTALEGAKPRAPLMFMLDGKTYNTIAK